MKRTRLDSRQQHDGIIRGLTNAQLSRMRNIARWRHRVDAAFFEQVIWWWRPLGKILEKQTPFEAVEARHVAFFPPKVWRTLQFSYLTGNIRALVNLWLGEEIAARHKGYSASYPGCCYIPNWAANFPEWRSWRWATIKIDLGRRNTDVVAKAKTAVDQQRQRIHSKTGVLGHGPAKIFFEADAFRACELMDREQFNGYWPNHCHPDPDAKTVVRRAQRAHLHERTK
jgi:hypothetical protein